MANWPCKTEDAIRARDQLAKTGRYIPRLLAAYDVTRTLIEPLKYEAKLKGALAKVVVSISRWCIQKEYTYCADIVEIHLLREPVALVNSGTPQKKKKVVRPSAPAHSPHKPGERYWYVTLHALVCERSTTLNIITDVHVSHSSTHVFARHKWFNPLLDFQAA